MRSAFICYRRDDTLAEANRLRVDLEEILVEGEVFLDSESIGAGDVWRDTLASRVAAANVVLVLIGNQWCGSRDDEDRNRLELEDDFVRYEILEAINREKTVIPVLVDLVVPLENLEIPSPLDRLKDRQAVQLRSHSWDWDVRDLTERLHREGFLTAIDVERSRREALRERMEQTVAAAGSWQTAFTRDTVNEQAVDDLYKCLIELGLSFEAIKIAFDDSREDFAAGRRTLQRMLRWQLHPYLKWAFDWGLLASMDAPTLRTVKEDWLEHQTPPRLRVFVGRLMDDLIEADPEERLSIVARTLSAFARVDRYL